MDCREELLRNLVLIMEEAGLPVDYRQYARNKILLELDKYDFAKKCTDLAVIDTESDRYIQLYLAMMHMQGRTERTIKAYSYVLKRFKNTIPLPVLEMNTIGIQIWLAKIQQNVSLSTCENFRSYISSFYSWLASEHVIQVSPMTAIKPIKLPKKIKHAFSDVEIDKLRSSCSSLRDRAILELLLSTGARVSEMCNMDKDDVNYSEHSIIIRKGKGNKQRTVYFNDVCREHLVQYLRSRYDDLPWLINTSRNTRISVEAVEHVLRLIGNRAHVTDVHPHRCRRTFATLLSKKGMDLSTLQTLMGHSDTNITRTYVELNQEYIKNQYSRFT